MPTSSGVLSSELVCAEGADLTRHLFPALAFTSPLVCFTLPPLLTYIYTTYRHATPNPVSATVMPSPARSSVTKDDGQVWRDASIHVKPTHRHHHGDVVKLVPAKWSSFGCAHFTKFRCDLAVPVLI